MNTNPHKFRLPQASIALVAVSLLLITLACGGSADETVTNTIAVDTPTPKPTITPIQTDASLAPATVNTGANLRAGPGTNYDVVGGRKKGDEITLVGRNEIGDWYKLSGGEWIAAFLVNNAPEELPILDATDPSATAAENVSPDDSEVPTVNSTPSSTNPIGVGTHIVGDTIQPGIYRGVAGSGLFDSCYWERLSNLSGEFDAIIANENSIGQFYVEVKPTDFALDTACQLIPLEQAPTPNVGNILRPGTYLVGRDIQPGTYKGQAGEDITDSCYWTRLKDVSGEMASIIANDNAQGSYFVQVMPDDFALHTACELSLIGE